MRKTLHRSVSLPGLVNTILRDWLCTAETELEQSPRRLSVEEIDGKRYYRDNRLQEYRNVSDPDDRRPFARCSVRRDVRRARGMPASGFSVAWREDPSLRGLVRLQDIAYPSFSKSQRRASNICKRIPDCTHPLFHGGTPRLVFTAACFAVPRARSDSARFA